eukprot:scaffold11197_cov67-Cylindrotheca_fusiformis.AAC.1
MVVGGIRSTGLTASLGIGNYVMRQLQCILGGLPNNKDNKKSSNAAAAATTCCKTTPLPPLMDMIQEFQQSSDGSVTIQGHCYRVTHPLTRLGWSTKNNNQAWMRKKNNSKL